MLNQRPLNEHPGDNILDKQDLIWFQLITLPSIIPPLPRMTEHPPTRIFQGNPTAKSTPSLPPTPMWPRTQLITTSLLFDTEFSPLNRSTIRGLSSFSLLNYSKTKSESKNMANLPCLLLEITLRARFIAQASIERAHFNIFFSDWLCKLLCNCPWSHQ